MERAFLIPILIFLYLLSCPFLWLRNFNHRIVRGLDWLFDNVAYLGWDKEEVDYWPLPRASDEPLPERRIKDG